MEWDNLLRPYRLGCPRELGQPDPNRNEFQRDYDRIIFSTAFRRLHGKTQVFPFPDSDVTHTRLTHSLECASVGRSLGIFVENELKKKYKDFKGSHLGDIVSAACLAHDIGNPPLGHSGEKAISEFFLSQCGQELISELSPEDKADFTDFQGNSMGFHVLTYSSPKLTEAEGGLGLTYPVLAAFVKYPRVSLIKDEKKALASEKKPGILKFDIVTYSEIAEELKIPLKKEKDRWYRHPLAFLTEAADDICYHIMDLEDGCKYNLLDYNAVSKLMINICNADSGDTETNALKKIIDKKNKIGYLRAKAINSLIQQVAKAFVKNEEDILNQEMEKPLCDLIESASIMKQIRDISKLEIYTYKPVLQVEAAGFQVLPGLLNTFLTAVINSKKSSSKKVLQLIPEEYKGDSDTTLYEKIVLITSYVAGMTDTFAIDTYRNLRGISLPNY